MKKELLMVKLTLLILLFTYGYSHPHTFIEVEPIIDIKDTKMNNLHVKWTIDEMTSMMLIMELDSDKNGSFNKTENNYIYKNYFSDLDKQEFYMKILSNKSSVPINPENFKASIEDNRLIYSFDIKKNIDTKNLKIGFFDKTLLVAMMLKKDHITLKGVNKKKSNQFKKDIFGVN